MELELKGKVALVTGGKRGIGAAVAAELACDRMHLCLVARDSLKLDKVAEGLVKMANIGVRVVAADVRDSAIPAQAVAEAVRHFGRIDVLVNNAGASRCADFFALTEQDWQDGCALSFHGYVKWPEQRGRTCALPAALWSTSPGTVRVPSRRNSSSVDR